jgi:alkaline phosphatase D
VSSGRDSRLLRGGLATPDTGPHREAVSCRGLTPGREYEAAIWFEDDNGQRGEVQHARFGTASERAATTGFVWTGDTAGQGWGINPGIGGMTA